MRVTNTILILAALLAATTTAGLASPLPPITALLPPITGLRESVEEVRQISLQQPTFLGLYRDRGLVGEAGNAADALEEAAGAYLRCCREQGIPPIVDLVDDLRGLAGDLRAAAGAYAAASHLRAALEALQALDAAAADALDRIRSTDALPPITL